jgi:TonB family protein
LDETTRVAKITKSRALAAIFWVIIAAGLDAQELPPPVPAAPRVATLVKPVVPDYPPVLATARMQGTVEVDLTVQPSGEVSDTRIVGSTFPLLDGLVISAVRQWLFAPRNDGFPVRVRARVHFLLSEPSMYPRPSRFDPPLPAWMPENFAFTYRYQCRAMAVEIDSIARTVRTRQRTDLPPQSIPFEFDGEDASDLLVQSVATGIQEMTPDSMWQEQPGQAEVVQNADEIVVTVPVESPVVDTLQPTLRPNTNAHRLAMRVGSRWKVYDWREPPAADQADRARQLSKLGAEIRELVRRNSDAAAPLRECLSR